MVGVSPRRPVAIVATTALLAALACTLLAAGSPETAQGSVTLRSAERARILGAGDAAAVGDVNGDGQPDVLVGHPSGGRANRRGSGSAVVLFGPVRGRVDLRRPQRGFRISGAAAGDRLGTEVAAPGDVNGDGLADLLLLAPTADPLGRRNAGTAWVIFGKRDGRPIDLRRPGRAGFRIDGPAAGGSSQDEPARDAVLAIDGAGDVNRDGRDDVVLGAPDDDPVRPRPCDPSTYGCAGPGRAYVVFGKPDAGRLDLANLGAHGFSILGNARAQGGEAAYESNLGTSVSGAGDANGDGWPDLVLGNRGYDNFGEVTSALLMFGGPGSADVRFEELRDRSVVIAGRGATGTAVDAAGDMNRDGLSDVLVGSPGGDPFERPSAAVVFGRSQPGEVNLRELAQSGNGRQLEGAGRGDDEQVFAGDHTGRAVAGVGDVNGDRFPDVLVGAPNSRPFARGRRRTARGAAYLVFGGPRAGRVDLSRIARSRGLRIVGSTGQEEFGRLVDASRGTGRRAELLVGYRGGVSVVGLSASRR